MKTCEVQSCSVRVPYPRWRYWPILLFQVPNPCIGATLCFLLSAFSGLPCAAVEVADARTIPLKQVWALAMPGTEPMNAARNVKADAFLAPEGPMVAEIVETLSSPEHLSPAVRKLLGDSSSAAFIVAGRKMAALRNAHDVIVRGNALQKSFQATEPLSVFFFTLSSGHYVHLTKVEQIEGEVRLTCAQVAHDSKELTVHLALAPIVNTDGAPIRIVIQRQPSVDDSSKVSNSSHPLDANVSRSLLSGSSVLSNVRYSPF